MSKIVISTGIAEIQKPRVASVEHLLVIWIPAIPAGMTLSLKQLYNQEITAYRSHKKDVIKKAVVSAG